MDYSLLVGIHDLKRGNKDNIRDNHLQLFQPQTKRVERQLSLRNKRESKAQIVRKAIATADPTKLDVSQLPDNTFTE
jgi:1-phosphatidylinositol-4-phosphate 5-kinase